MKATKEQIIEIGLKAVKDIYKVTGNEKTVIATEEKVNLYMLGEEGYYTHDGWVFITKNRNAASGVEESVLIYLLDDGTPVSCESVTEGLLESVRPLYILKDKSGQYRTLDKASYFKHHNFDFTKKEFERMKYNF